MEKSELYLVLGIGALVVITIGLIMSKKFRGKLTKDGLEVESTNNSTKTKVENVKNQSEIDLESPENRNIEIKDIDNSTIKIKK